MTTDWGAAVVVDPRELTRMERDLRDLYGSRTWLRRACAFALGSCLVAAGGAHRTGARLEEVTREAHLYRHRARRSSEALAVLARSHDRILDATEHAPSVGSRSWGRRFTVTKYLPRDPSYGKFNDGLTATMTKADPAARIVAVDPTLIPYGSWVWVEDLGWFRAEDCGAAIKGFRLDLLTGRLEDATTFGKQERFVIVVPPGEA